MMVSTASHPVVNRDDRHFLEDRDRLTAMSRAELETMAKAAADVFHCLRVLAKTRDTVVGDLLRGSETFHEWDHYPPHEAYDPETHAQYYYHTHPPEQRAVPPDQRAVREHGHFHLFLRPKGMPEGIAPMPIPGSSPPTGDNDVACHLVAISMDRYGMPLRVFTTNRWVTKKTWYRADDVVRMLDRFVIDVARPNWLINRWLTAMVMLFRPQIIDLIHARDAAIAQWNVDHPDVDAFEDQRLAVTSAKRINVQQQFDAITRALRLVKKGDHRDGK